MEHASGDETSSRSVVVVDDHPCLRRGLLSVLASSPQLRVVGEAADGREALAVIRQHRPDIVVLDLLLPHLNGIQVMHALLGELPHLKFVAYSLREEPWFVQEALAAGAARYVSKRRPPSELVLAIEQAAAADSPASLLDERDVAADAPDAARGAEGVRLSKRECEALRLISRGIKMKDAARELQVGVRTLETYKARAMQKLQLRSRADLIRFAEHSGWLEDGN